jgi:hypothetical protein
LQQKYDILNEVLYGQHLNKDLEVIDVAQRGKYGNVGLFYTIICAVLNDGKSYPSFNKSKAVQSTVKSWVDEEAEEPNLAKRLSSMIHLWYMNFIHRLAVTEPI